MPVPTPSRTSAARSHTCTCVPSGGEGPTAPTLGGQPPPAAVSSSQAAQGSQATGKGTSWARFLLGPVRWWKWVTFQTAMGGGERVSGDQWEEGTSCGPWEPPSPRIQDPRLSWEQLLDTSGGSSVSGRLGGDLGDGQTQPGDPRMHQLGVGSQVALELGVWALSP